VRVNALGAGTVLNLSADQAWPFACRPAERDTVVEAERCLLTGTLNDQVDAVDGDPLARLRRLFQCHATVGDYDVQPALIVDLSEEPIGRGMP
jgi:hypothetical protein